MLYYNASLALDFKLVRYFFAVLLILSLPQLSFAKGLVVSTYPLFLIAQEVTAGIEQPTLLLTQHQTGHDAQLTPKNRQAIQEADLIVWLGKQHEVPLQSTLENKKNAISILDSNVVKTLPQRDVKGNILASDSIDTHVWLEPNNAVRIAFFIAALRSQQEPQAKAQYFQNAKDFSKKMYDATNITINGSQERNYWAYHDAYQYLERALQLKFAGSLSSDHDLAPTVTQIKYLTTHRPQTQMCLLAEYHADQSLIQRLKPVKMVAVDESMADQKDFVTAWLKLANSIQQCFR